MWWILCRLLLQTNTEHHKMNQTESFIGIWLVHKRNLSSVQKPSELSVLPGLHLSHTLGYLENAVAWEITDQRLAFFFTVIMHCSHKRLICRQWKMNMDTFTNVYWSLKWMPGNLKSRKREWRRDEGMEASLPVRQNRSMCEKNSEAGRK